MHQAQSADTPSTSLLVLFGIFLRLGCCSFGGPVAHIGFLHREFVERRKWLSDAAYSDLVALCQFLPGPSSSQLAMAIGQTRGGAAAAVVAWLGFVLPSALLMFGFATGLTALAEVNINHFVHMLKLAACAVVAQALYLMFRNLCRSIAAANIALSAALLALMLPALPGQLTALAFGAVMAYAFALPQRALHASSIAHCLPHAWATGLLLLWLALLALLPLASVLWPQHALDLFDGFYRSGSLVFGGAHVVLPLLQAQVVDAGWLSNDRFLAGYGFAQAMPGPLFSFAVFLGAASNREPAGLLGGVLALVAIYLPSLLLVLGILPFWQRLAQLGAMQRAMPGVLAAVVGILLAALIDPVASSALFGLQDWLLFAGFLALLHAAKAAPWLIVCLALAVAQIAQV